MKFRLHEKLKYMVLGSLLTLAGFIFGNMSNDTEAQFGSESIDELTVDELRVRDLIVLEDIVLVAGRERRVIISHDEDGGSVSVYGPGGKGSAGLWVDKWGGRVSAHSSVGKGSAGLWVDKWGGRVSVYSLTGNKGSAGLSIDGKGGRVSVYSLAGKESVYLWVDENGGKVSVNGDRGETGVLIGTTEDDGVINLVDRFGGIRILKP